MYVRRWGQGAHCVSLPFYTAWLGVWSSAVLRLWEPRKLIMNKGNASGLEGYDPLGRRETPTQ